MIQLLETVLILQNVTYTLSKGKSQIFEILLEP